MFSVFFDGQAEIFSAANAETMFLKINKGQMIPIVFKLTLNSLMSDNLNLLNYS